MKVMWILSGVIFLAASGYSGLVGYDDTGSTDVEIPSCSVAELELENACDKSLMLDAEGEIPEFAMSVIDIEILAEWDLTDVWLGVVEESEASKCTETTDGLLLCDTDDLVFYAGGPDTDGSLEWEVGEGKYRFVGGSSVASSGQTAHIVYNYNIHASTLVASVLGLVGVGMAGWGMNDD